MLFAGRAGRPFNLYARKGINKSHYLLNRQTATLKTRPIHVFSRRPCRKPEGEIVFVVAHPLQRLQGDPALCESAKANLESLNNYVRIRVQSADGSFRILNPEERDAERAKAEKIIRLNCE